MRPSRQTHRQRVSVRNTAQLLLCVFRIRKQQLQTDRRSLRVSFGSARAHVHHTVARHAARPGAESQIFGALFNCCKCEHGIGYCLRFLLHVPRSTGRRRAGPTLRWQLGIIAAVLWDDGVRIRGHWAGFALEEFNDRAGPVRSAFWRVKCGHWHCHGAYDCLRFLWVLAVG